ncbi:serine/threonine-protein kinase [Planobispora takensis]|uniref:Serine/threonine protein kinase n=1 Tax=Planobispora takensis TaxID=1367882 RepID=A0A8J3SX93_9ACTN|nr:serine/threonine-protein kinase [Planobispora takensis]GII00481.1 serine/threonine protein kinase [Planobispora takensis]
MPVDPLRAADPAWIGGHRITGRLGAGGQGVVYLAESPSGERVAVKLLRAGSDDSALTEFHREIELALRVKAFCTAQVLEHGEFGGAPYIVSEYVDGPSLAQVIDERGVLRGTELRRLAIGMLTALSAIHQAGVVHRDLKPANVLLARDGPRVIDFGIARAEDSEATAEHIVGTPPYMAPEQFSGAPTGPASDMFAWAATVTCAATGSPPFGTGPVPATIHRILSGEPKVGELEGELRELVLQCLAKDPAVRPTATAALLRLLGHAVAPPRLLAEGRARAGGRDPGVEEDPSLREGDTIPSSARGMGEVMRGRRGIVTGLAAVVLALASGAGIHMAVGDRPDGGASGGGTAERGTAAPPAQRRTGGTMAAESTTSVRIPGTEITLRENPADSWRVTSYEDNREVTSSGPPFVRARDGDAFEKFEGRNDLVVSPGGSFFVVSPHFKTDFFDFDQIRIVDRATGGQSVVRTVRRPAQSRYPRWSPDGSRVLLTTFETVGPHQLIGRSTGFTIVDAATRSARFVAVADDNDQPYIYAWGPDGTTVVQQAPGGAVRVRNLDGSLVRTLRSVGQATWDDVAVTPLGTVVTTVCPDKSGNICLWDYVTGAKKATVPLPEGTDFAGWLGERNLLGIRSRGKDREVVMLDLQGRAVRVLAEGPATAMDQIDLTYTAR